VARHLRRRGWRGDEAEDRPDLFSRLILTTGDVASPALSDFLTRTPRPVIEKPFQLAALAQVIEAVLQAR
jgi:hypothetical protein